LLWLKSKEVKNQFLIDFWIKIGLEIDKGILVVEIFWGKIPREIAENLGRQECGIE
jgi:hypothetical protein